MSERKTDSDATPACWDEETYLEQLREYVEDDSRRESWRKFNEAKHARAVEEARNGDPARRLLDLAL